MWTAKSRFSDNTSIKWSKATLYSYTKNNNITDVLCSFLNTNGQSEPVPSSENKHNVIGVEYSANQYMW